MKPLTHIVAAALLITVAGWAQTVKTIKPDGSGDYTTLQAWHDWAKTQTNAAQWAECYSGGDLGALTWSSWTATPSATNYPKIYAAAGQQHDGLDNDSGAYSTGTMGFPINYTRYVGLRISGPNIGFVAPLGRLGVVIDRCFIEALSYGVRCWFGGASYADLTIKNCIIVPAFGGVPMGGISLLVSGGSARTNSLTVVNCSTFGYWKAVQWYRSASGNPITLFVTIQNVAAFNGYYCFAQDLDTGPGSLTVTFNNNASSDATAGNFGGTGNLTNQVDTTWFTDPANTNLSLTTGSPGIDAGTNTSSITTDIVGTARPQGSAYDIGAFEYIVPELVGHWKFDEGTGTNALDSTTNNHHGLLIGSPLPSWTSGVFSNALAFDGSQNEVVVSNYAKLSPTAALTVSTWVRPFSTNEDFTVSKWATNGLSGSYLLWVTATNAEFSLFLTGSEMTVVGTAALSLSNWHHVVGVYASTQMQLYVDGSLQSIFNANGLINVVSEPLRMGGVKGGLDDVRLYNYALAGTNILALYEADTDSDGLPDVFEINNFGNLSQGSGGDPDGDGLTNLQEYQQGKDPNDYYNGVLPNLSIASGNGQTGLTNSILSLPLKVLVTNSVAGLLTNAPVTYAVVGTNGWVTTNSVDFLSSLVVRTGTNGQASVNYKLSTVVGTNTIAVKAISAGQTNTVTFSEYAAVDNGSSPVLAFVDPASNGAALGFQDVLGTATTTNPVASIVSWTLNAVRTDGTDSFVVSTGATAVVSASLGRFDSTLRRNGPYVLTLAAQDSFSRTNQITLTVLVEGEAKPGQFSFSQQDVVIPVSGVPLTVVRTYSSLLQNRSADFGYGWTYSIADVDLEIDEKRGTINGVEGNFSMRTNGNRNVTLTLPDGRRTTFYFYLQQFSSTEWRARWTNAPGVTATLALPSGVNDKLIYSTLFGYYYWQGGDQLTPQAYYDFSGWVLTLKDKTEYLVERNYQGNYTVDDVSWPNNAGGTGFAVDAYTNVFLAKITEPNGNRVEFSSGGITNFNGSGTATKFVTFTRDGSNRITALRDPNSSIDTVTYRYSSSGNLTNVVRLVNTNGPVYETTTYLYENGSFPHYITSIKDPRGITPLRSLYDSDGRLIGTVDAFNKTNSISRNLTARTETITDRLGSQTIHVYDERGNVISTTDAVGTTTRVYDTNDNLLIETNAVGLATSYTYDSKRNRTSVTDPLTNKTYFTYDSFSNVLTITNALGRATIHQYDGDGNLTQTTDAAGKTTTYTYDGNGNRLSETNALGQGTRYQYDANGFLTNTIDAAGHATASTYDANGNQLTSTTTRTTPSGTETLLTTSLYDALNRVIKTINPLSGTNHGFSRLSCKSLSGRAVI